MSVKVSSYGSYLLVSKDKKKKGLVMLNVKSSLSSAPESMIAMMMAEFSASERSLVSPRGRSKFT